MAEKMTKIDLFLHWQSEDHYENTAEENELVTKWQALYRMADNAKETIPYARTSNIRKWREAYYGTLPTLSRDGQPSTVQGRQLRKVIYEFIESKIDNDVPQPKMVVKHKMDLPMAGVSEDYLRNTINNVMTRHINDRSERACMTDGTVWYKVWWDSTDSKYENSGNVKIELRTADQIVPQPGVLNYKDLEYIFELEQCSVSKIYETYGRLVTVGSADSSKPADPNNNADRSTVTIVNAYYINCKGYVGKFSWVKDTLQVICNEEFWQIRKLRKCKICKTIVPTADVCPICGSKSFKYEVAEEDILDEDLVQIYNPYEAGETDDVEKKDEYKTKPFLTAGTNIPFYQLKQLPFVPRVNISSIETLYGLSDSMMMLEMQDVINKMYTQIIDKSLDSSAILVKNNRQRIDTDTDGIRMINVNSYEESEAIKVIQAQADMQNDMLAAQMLYESAKSSTGITESYQGKYDASATSGKAKEFSASQSASRLESYKAMKATAFAGIYELALKFLIAFSDEKRKFVKTLPNGDTEEETWNKYMFLAKTDDGEIYYRDDFTFETDPAATLAGNRVAMWQEMQSQFLQGTMGDVANDRTRELFWNMLDQYQYPLAKLVLAGIKENSQHLPPDIEQVLLQNPNVLQQVMAQFQQAGLLKGQGNGTGGQGGARPNTGPEGNGMSQAGNVEANNERDRTEASSPLMEGEDNGANW